METAGKGVSVNKEALVQVAEEVRRATGLPVGWRDVERTLGALRATRDLWEAVRLSRVPLRFLVPIWEGLARRGLLRVEEGLDLLAEVPAPRPGEAACPACEGRGLVGERLPGRAAERFLAWAKERPEAIQDFDQGYVTPESTLARVALAWNWGDLGGKEVLVLGDDDLTGLAAALTGLPKRVVVLDADPRIVRFLERAAKAEGLPSGPTSTTSGSLCPRPGSTPSTPSSPTRWRGLWASRPSWAGGFWPLRGRGAPATWA